jgi:hypothetical protein
MGTRAPRLLRSRPAWGKVQLYPSHPSKHGSESLTTQSLALSVLVFKPEVRFGTCTNCLTSAATIKVAQGAVITSGLVPPAFEASGQPLADLLKQVMQQEGLGIEVTSSVNDLPKGSRLAVSTSLLASLISICMRATGQIGSLSGSLS